MKHPYLAISFTKSRPNSKKILSRLSFIFAENSPKSFLQEYQLELVGVFDMVKGLEYHYKKFQNIEKKYLIAIAKTFEEKIEHSTINKQNMIHEVVAYLNRLGQIEALITSVWFKSHIKEIDLVKNCPTIFALMPFRNKYAAHRSLDDPRKETEDQKANHASLPFVIKSGGPIDGINKVKYTIKIAKVERDKGLLGKYHSDAVAGIEDFTENEIFLTFIPSDHHVAICSEILVVFEKIFQEHSYIK